MLDNSRDLFPIFSAGAGKNLAYLDNAASTQKPTVVLEQMDKFYRTSYANVHRGLYKLAENATTEYEAAREIVRKFINAKKDSEIIFTRNTNASLNLVAQSYCQQLAPGDEILLTEMEHHANLVPWQQMAQRYKLKVRYLPITTEGRLDEKKYDDYFNSRTRVVSLTAMSNVLGTVPVLEPLIARAKAARSRVIIDAAQAVAHFPVDVQKLGIDALAFSGHKIFGPTGIGVLYGQEEFLNAIPPFEYGSNMIDQVTYEAATWSPLPTKFEAGTPPIAEVIGLGAALEFIKRLGWPVICQHEADLTAYGLSVLLKVKSLKIIGPHTPENRGPIFAFTVDGVHPHDLASVLDSVEVAVRSGHHCALPLHSKFGLTASTRASFTIYNTKQEIDRLVEGIKQTQKLFS
ncbi:MAG: SufS family cysteine desulfurase [Candidatus Kerfeldbacteria bacterium]|nr:SufS family cysteine desulfurase [Candidatus Kerfeldbacteria bacterium]